MNTRFIKAALLALATIALAACDKVTPVITPEPEIPTEPEVTPEPEKPTEPEVTPEPDELPDEAKFKLKMVQLTPFMNLDTPLAAPFDFLTFRILDHNDGFSLVAPAFLDYYDRIEMSSPSLPDTYTIYSRRSDGSGGKFTSQWSSYFYEKSDFQICLKGYKDGELIYEYSMLQIMRERDFLGVDWKNGSIALANPSTNGIYNVLDTRYKFLLTDTQMIEETPYVRISVAWSSDIPDDEWLEQQAEGLRWLLRKYLVKSSLSASDFKTLPEGAEIVETYESRSTRAAILHQIPDDLHEELYFAIAEAR